MFLICHPEPCPELVEGLVQGLVLTIPLLKRDAETTLRPPQAEAQGRVRHDTTLSKTHHGK